VFCMAITITLANLMEPPRPTSISKMPLPWLKILATTPVTPIREGRMSYSRSAVTMQRGFASSVDSKVARQQAPPRRPIRQERIS
jgi:hypothetical protein